MAMATGNGDQLKVAFFSLIYYSQIGKILSVFALVSAILAELFI